MQLCTASQIRCFDEETIAAGITGAVLMERAGQHVCDTVLRLLDGCTGKRIVIVAGGGNNGGDGFVVARLLQQMQAKVQVFLLVPPARLTGDAKLHFDRLDSSLVTELLSEEAVAGCKLRADLVVDSLLGTGLSRSVTGRFAIMIGKMNDGECPVIAVDIPSGLDADTGQVLGCAVRADATVTFHLQKLGMAQFPGLEYVGGVTVVDIGLTPEPLSALRTPRLLTHDVAGGLLPRRVVAGHKGSFGHVLVVAGSRGKTGAAILAGRGCLRAGAGLVSLCVPERLQNIFAVSLPEAMTISMLGQDGYVFGNGDLNTIMAAVQGKGSLVLGPGLGQADGTGQLVRQLVQECHIPLVIDADGLNLLGQHWFAGAEGREIVLTPHPGEMARLSGKTVAEVQASRVAIASAFARETSCVVVLKGAATVVAGPEGEVAINSTGNAGMGAGGMGDVLSGVIGAFLARGLSGFDAACLAVFAHGLAGDLLVESGMPMGYLASELADTLPDVWQELTAR